MLRSLVDILGLLIFLVGFCATVIGLLTAETIGAVTSVAVWGGVVMMLFGWLIGHNASTKACPACAERVKYKAAKCKHCGSDLTVAKDSAAAPSYK